MLKCNIKSKSAGVTTAPQRLYTESQKYAYLVGLIEGDGWFSFSKNGKYLIYEMGIELNIKDLPLLRKIKYLLENVGNINIYKNNTKCRYNIRNKNDLRRIILPIFDKYPMLSKKSHTYFRFRYLLLMNCVYYEQIEYHYQSKIYKQALYTFETIQSKNNTFLKIGKYPKYFSYWLVGFIEAEGSFSIYPIKRPAKYDNFYVASFEIGQNNAELLISAIQLFLNLKTKITKISNQSNNFYKLKVSSVKCITNLVKFLDCSSAPLLGYKKQQYNEWRNQLEGIPRYAHIVASSEP